MTNELVPYSDIEKMGSVVAKSGLFGVKTVEQAVALMLVAQAYGKHPAQAAMEYNIINNRPAKKSEAILASFQEAGGIVRWIELTDKKAKAEFSHPSGGKLELEWTIEMAKAAGLVDKEYSNYKKYPRAMLRSRVVAEGVRAVFPAATGGMLSKEEAEDIVEVTATEGKSRVEALVENQVQEAEVTKSVQQREEAAQATHQEQTPPKDDKPKESKKTGKSKANLGTDKPVLAEGIKTVIGLVDNTIQGNEGEVICYLKTKEPVMNPNTGIAAIKHSFLIRLDGKDQRYGTWDADLAHKVMDCIDNRRLVKFEYKERKNEKGTVFNDIVSFSEASTEDMANESE